MLGLTANTADIVVLQGGLCVCSDGKNGGEEGGMEVKKHIVRYYHSSQRNHVKPLSTCLSADYDIYPCCDE